MYANLSWKKKKVKFSGQNVVGFICCANLVSECEKNPRYGLKKHLPTLLEVTENLAIFRDIFLVYNADMKANICH